MYLWKNTKEIQILGNEFKHLEMVLNYFLCYPEI